MNMNHNLSRDCTWLNRKHKMVRPFRDNRKNQIACVQWTVEKDFQIFSNMISQIISNLSFILQNHWNKSLDSLLTFLCFSKACIAFLSIMQSRSTRVKMSLENFHESYVQKAIEFLLEDLYKKHSKDGSHGLSFDERRSIRSMFLTEWSSWPESRQIHEIYRTVGLPPKTEVPIFSIWNWKRMEIAAHTSPSGQEAVDLYMKPAPEGSCRIVIRCSSLTYVK